MQSILGSVAALAVGVITAILSVQLALRRFRNERWWERKAQAYTDLFEALFDVQLYARRKMEEMEEGVSFAEAYIRELGERSSAGFTRIRKYAAMGPFLFSPDVAKRLAQLERDLDVPTHDFTPEEEIGHSLDAVTSALQDLRLLAHRDLKVRD